MKVFHVRGVSEALALGVQTMKHEGIPVNTRNGPALEMPTPVCTTYTHPEERVLFYSERDANPFFHFMESLWMLDGRNDVKWLSLYLENIKKFSDDGKIFHGAYGYRWRNFFSHDQLETIIFRLKKYPNDRRCVLQMWDADSDLLPGNDMKDVPCNTTVYFYPRNPCLDMTVCNRSNDMIWGAYGANAVHMSYLLEYVASMISAPMGHYYQISNNFHAYLDTFEKVKNLLPEYEPYTYYSLGSPAPLMTNRERFDKELEAWMNGDETRIENEIFTKTATPMKRAWRYYKEKDILRALAESRKIKSLDWQKACVEWLQRRLK